MTNRDLRPSLDDLLDGHPNAGDSQFVELMAAVRDSVRLDVASKKRIVAAADEIWINYQAKIAHERNLVLDERIRFLDVLTSPIAMANFNLALRLLCKTDRTATEIIAAITLSAAQSARPHGQPN